MARGQTKLAANQTGLWPSMRYQATKVVRSLPLYGTTLGDADPGPLVFNATHPWRGDPARGAAIRDGSFPFAGKVVRQANNPWAVTDASDAWLAALHGFTWLADLNADNTDGSKRRAVGLVMDWIDHNQEWSPQAWNAATVGARISSWLMHFSTCFGETDELVQRRIRKSILRQFHHLHRVAPYETDGAARLIALKGLVLACLSFASLHKSLEGAGSLLSAEFDRQVLPDGGHIERSPMVLLGVLRLAIDVRYAYRTAQQPVPNGVQNAIDRMTPMIRFFRHGDGGLAHFNDTTEGRPSEIDLVLSLSESDAKPPIQTPHSGFQRLQAAKTLLLMDVGPPPLAGIDRHGHAGTLSLEISQGKDRIIVNCGAAMSDDLAWREAQRSTPAHSTLTLAMTNSSALTDEGFGDRRASVTSERDSADGATWLSARHDGYASLLGFYHNRRVFLSESGLDIRGEDSLLPVDPAQPVTPRRFELRFHLYPGSKVSLLANQSAALLQMPSGAGWRFRSSGAAIRLEDSIYMGKRGDARRTQQIVLVGDTGAGEKTIKWALQKEGTK